MEEYSIETYRIYHKPSQTLWAMFNTMEEVQDFFADDDFFCDRAGKKHEFEIIYDKVTKKIMTYRDIQSKRS